MEINEIKKDLFKSKNMANFSHYRYGNLYYIVDLVDGVYEFPIAVVENNDDSIELSKDLGTTSFNNEIKGSELSRWIANAVENNTFIKVL